MWMFMLLMMVFTRTRSEEESQVPTNHVVARGSVSATRMGMNRRRKRDSLETNITEHSAAAEQQTVVATEQRHAVAAEQQHTVVVEEPAAPRKRRGPSLNRSINTTLQNLPAGSKVPLTLDKDTKMFIGDSATMFATECGIVIRNECPMNYHTWDSVPQEDKAVLYEKLEGKFQLLREDNVFMEYVNSRLQAQWKRTRGVLSKHWKDNGGKTNPKSAREKMAPGCRNEDDWNNLCNYWELEKTQKYSDKMEANRGKQVNVSRGGSRSIANHAFKLTNPETQMPPTPFDLYYKLHFNEKKKGWLCDEAQIEYDNLTKHKQAAMDKLNSEGITITTAMQRKLEKEAIKSICGKLKTIQSGWEVGVGPVLRKKDSWMKSVARSSQHESSETNIELSNQVIALKEELKKSNEKQKKMYDFFISRFPEFSSTMSTPTGDEADEPSSDSENYT